MANRIVIVTACDRRYMPLLLGLLESLGGGGILRSCDVVALDIDFTEVERTAIRALGAQVHKATEAPVAVPSPDPDGRHAVMTYRVTLPAMFPGYETYISLDADVWVQDRAAIAILLRAAQSGSLAIALELDRAYRLGEAEFKWLEQGYASIYGPARALELMRHPTLNTGVFALRGDSPVWGVWRAAYQRALDAGADWFTAGQAVLTHLRDKREIAVHPVPAACNWMAHLALPQWDAGRAAFVTPIYPHEKILALHQTDVLKTRKVPIRLPDGSRTEALLNYATYRRLRNQSRRRTPLPA